MVAEHKSNDGMVTIHRYSLSLFHSQTLPMLCQSNSAQPLFHFFLKTSFESQTDCFQGLVGCFFFAFFQIQTGAVAKVRFLCNRVLIVFTFYVIVFSTVFLTVFTFYVIMFLTVFTFYAIMFSTVFTFYVIVFSTVFLTVFTFYVIVFLTVFTFYVIVFLTCLHFM